MLYVIVCASQTNVFGDALFGVLIVDWNNQTILGKFDPNVIYTANKCFIQNGAKQIEWRDAQRFVDNTSERKKKKTETTTENVLRIEVCQKEDRLETHTNTAITNNKWMAQNHRLRGQL